MLDERGQPPPFLIRDRDAWFLHFFDVVFAAEGAPVVRTPVRAPGTNAFAERWVEAVRADCLDWLLVIRPRHPDRVLRTDAEHRDPK